MSQSAAGYRLSVPVAEGRDHILGPRHADICLVEYGSYACPHCRAANARIEDVRNRFGDRMSYVFRHRPLTGSDIARRAAELVELADSPEKFWNAHVKLMTRSETLTEDDLVAVAEDLGVTALTPAAREAAQRRARERVEADMRSAGDSGVMITPTFFINERRYDGPWDESSFADAMLGSLGHRVRAAALEFASWAPSTGALLLLASVVAVLLTNSTLGAFVEGFWEQHLAFVLGERRFDMSLRHWINDGLLTLFFFVVALEIKREFTVGHLASRRSAALPVAAAIGGMAIPALIYILLVPAGDWSHGWGVPMATDTAFAVALIAMLGRRVPVELRIFLTAAAIVDDIGAIAVVAIFYSGKLRPEYLVLAAAIVGVLALLNRAHVYRAAPYVLLGVVLWVSVHGGGLHATLAGVLLALFIPTRPPPDLRTLMLQADQILTAEARHSNEALRRGPSEPSLQALDAIHDRLESPADRMLRHLGPRSSYFVLPLFALANAGGEITGTVFGGHGGLMIAIAAGLMIGKPVGLVAACALAVWTGIAVKPAEYSWLQLVGAGALAGIGFTMSLFIAGQAFAAPEDFAAAKIAVFGASVLSAFTGVAILWFAGNRQARDAATVAP
jgi:NhaA family Na+:H+ antiporter